jgi:hypothetical protein
MRKTTLIVLAIALALAGYLYFYELPHGRGRDATKEESVAAFSFAADDVTGIVLERAGTTVRMEKRDGTWVITAPVETRADQSVASGLASSAAGARVQRWLEADAERRKQFGLDPPAVTLRLRLTSGAEHTLQLGARDFSGLSVYARVDQHNQVALLPSALLSSADKPLDELRDRSVLAFNSWEVNGAELRTPRARFRLERRGDGWFLTAPRELRADENAVRDLLDAVAFARLATVVAESVEQPARYGLDRPQYELRIRTEKGEERTLLVGRRTRETPQPAHYYARDVARSMIFTVGEELVRELNRSLADLRSKRIAHFDRAQLRRIELRNQHLTLVAETTDGEQWLVREPAEKKDQPAQVSRILSTLEFTRAEVVLDTPSAVIVRQLQKPAVEITLSSADGSTLHIAVSAVHDGKVYARSGTDAAVFQFSETFFQQLNLQAQELIPGA